MAREVEDEAFRKEVKCWCAPTILTVVLWVAALTAKLGSEGWALAAVWLIPVPLTIIQVAVNRINDAAAQQKTTAWTRWDIAIASVCGLFWILIGLGLLLKFTSPTLTDNG